MAEDWSDWGLVASRKSKGKTLEATIAHGIPMTYFKAEGFDPSLRFGADAFFYDENLNQLQFPIDVEKILVLMDGAYYGLHLPTDTKVRKNGINLTFKADFFTLSVLPEASAFNEFHLHAFNIPKETQVEWTFDADNACLKNTWSIVTENPTGAPAGNLATSFQ